MGIGIGQGRQILAQVVLARVIPLAPLAPLRSATDQEGNWSLDARMAMFVLEAGGDLATADAPQMTQRRSDRQPCRLRATLTPLLAASDSPSVNITIYLRDLSDTHAGFIANRPLDVGGSCWFQLSNAAGGNGSAAEQSSHPAAVVCRCRQFMEGWWEGVIQFAPAPNEAVEPVPAEPLRVAV